MSYQIDSYSIVFFSTAMIAAITAFAAWRRRLAPGAIWLCLAMVAATEWLLASGMEVAAVALSLKITWAKLLYIGAHTSCPFILLFALEFTHRTRWVTRRNILLLFIIPVVTITLAATNQWHHLVWSGFTPQPDIPNMVVYQHGPWFWVGMVYINLLMVWASLALITFALRSHELYRYQSIGFVIAGLFPWIGTGIYISNFNPFPGLDTAAVGLIFSGVIIVFLIQKMKLLDVIPVARDILIENMTDGIIVLDAQNRIVDINPAIKRMFGKDAGWWISKPAEHTLADWPEMIKSLGNKEGGEHEFALKQPSPIQVSSKISPIYGLQGDITGHLIFIQDITRCHSAENALRQANLNLQSKQLVIEGLQDQLRDQAIRDPLTDLFNQRYLKDTLEREIARAERDQSTVGVVMLDVDFFKTFNDTYGHSTGDAVLQAFAKLLKAQTRTGDIACRYGGDEFVAVITGISIETLCHRVDQWRAAFGQTVIIYEEQLLRASISAGVAVFPMHGNTAASILRAADTALYDAKNAGRNQVRMIA